MTAKLLSLAAMLATFIPARATAAGLAVNVRALVLIVLLAACARLAMAAGRRVLAFRSSPYMRPSLNGYANA